MKPNTYLLEDDFKELERILRDGTTPQDWEHAKMLYFFINTKIQNSRFSPEPYQITPQQEHILETYRQQKKAEHPIIDEKVPLSLLSKVLLISFVAIFLIGSIIAYIAYTRITPDEKVIADAEKALKTLPDSSKFGVLSVDTLQKIKKELTAQINIYKEKPTEENKEKLEEKLIASKSLVYSIATLKTTSIASLFLYYEENEEDAFVLMENNAKYDLQKAKKIYIKFLNTFDKKEKVSFSYTILNQKTPKIKRDITDNRLDVTEIIKDYKKGYYTIRIYIKKDNKQELVKEINFTLY
ncbi:MAG: hypothetical protein EAZ95_10355 [Bacteroidetes bacterium]|nr:MAG: hypothetical protein EAZ95_10355 [Bacteroidota bacterium]